MGAFFSNLHVKKESVSIDNVKSLILEYFLEKGFVQADKDTADFDVNIYAPENSRWISVYCDAFTHDDILSLCPRVSKSSGNDVLGIACFDSDYMFLNLINVNENRDLWLNIGGITGLNKPRRTNLIAWKSSVKSIDAFKSEAKKEYVCAEDFLLSAQNELDLSFEQSTGFDISDGQDKLFFTAPQKDSSCPTKLELSLCDLTHCNPGERKTLSFCNEGSASRGLAIIFFGDYVDNNEITIDDPILIYHKQSAKQIDIPITFTKSLLEDGKLVYYWEDKNFKIPQAVSQDLHYHIKDKKESLSRILLRFTPNGNKRKFLDISVVFAPLSNWSEGQCLWRAWLVHNSKREYVEDHNRTLKEFNPPNIDDLLINPDEYDLD